MASSTRTITKVLAAEEDLLWGEGEVTQLRGDESLTLNKIRGFRPVNTQEEFDALDETKYPKVVMVQNGIMTFYQYNGSAYEVLIFQRRLDTVVTADTAFSAISKHTVVYSATSAHTIANITNGFAGQEINLISTTSNTTIANNAIISLKLGGDLLIPANTGIRLVCLGSVWVEV